MNRLFDFWVKNVIIGKKIQISVRKGGEGGTPFSITEHFAAEENAADCFEGACFEF